MSLKKRRKDINMIGRTLLEHKPIIHNKRHNLFIMYSTLNIRVEHQTSTFLPELEKALSFRLLDDGKSVFSGTVLL